MINEEGGNYLNERIGKITNALYKVTDFLLDREPIKWSLRDVSVDILMNIVSLKDKNQQDKATAFVRIFDLLNKMIYLLDLASVSGFIVGLNFEILKREYEKIGKLIESDKEEEILFSDKLFPELSDNVHKAGLFGKGQANEYYGHNGQHKGQGMDKGQEIYKGQSKSITSGYYGIKGKDNLRQGGNNVDRHKDNFNNKDLPDNQKDTQSKDIIDFVKRNGHVTIKDISSGFPDLSQKTIQRRLLHVGDIGLMEKEGNKRWRKYFVRK